MPAIGLQPGGRSATGAPARQRPGNLLAEALYPLASSELPPRKVGRRRQAPADTTYTEPQRLHKVLAAAGIGSPPEIEE